MTTLKANSSLASNVVNTDLYKYYPDAAFPIHAVSYHVATDKPPPAQNGDKFRSILATIYNQSQLAERKHVARYWSINTAATAVPLSAHPSPLVITTKLAAAILGGRLFGGSVLPAQYCPCGSECFCGGIIFFRRCGRVTSRLTWSKSCY